MELTLTLMELILKLLELKCELTNEANGAKRKRLELRSRANGANNKVNGVKKWS